MDGRPTVAHTGRVLVVRADAGVAMGGGHVMRCLALAQSWRDQGGEVQWVTAGTLGRMREPIAAEGATVNELGIDPGSAADAEATARLAAAAGAGWVVVDGYHLGRGLPPAGSPGGAGASDR